MYPTLDNVGRIQTKPELTGHNPQLIQRKNDTKVTKGTSHFVVVDALCGCFMLLMHSTEGLRLGFGLRVCSGERRGAKGDTHLIEIAGHLPRLEVCLEPVWIPSGGDGQIPFRIPLPLLVGEGEGLFQHAVQKKTGMQRWGCKVSFISRVQSLIGDAQLLSQHAGSVAGWGFNETK